MTDKQNFEVNARFEYGTYLTPNAKGKNINAPSNRPDWRITLQADHIKRLEEELKAKEQECEELKKTLTEIKEIAKTQQSWNEWNRQFSETESEDDIFAYNWSALKQILQKISECEVGNE